MRYQSSKEQYEAANKESQIRELIHDVERKKETNAKRLKSCCVEYQKERNLCRKCATVNNRFPSSIPRYPPQTEGTVSENSKSREHRRQENASTRIKINNELIMELEKLNLIVDIRSELFSLFSGEQPRGERPHSGDVVNSAPQSHRSCVNDEFFRRFRNNEIRAMNLQFRFKNLHVTVVFGPHNRRCSCKNQRIRMKSHQF